MILRSSPSDLRATRESSILACAALLCALAGCTAAPVADFPTAAELPTDRRRPDGVAIDPASAPPPAADRGVAADGLVTLRAPLGVDVAVAVVAEFFKRVVLEDGDGLSALLTRDALAIAPGSGGGQGQTPSAGLWWEQRFRRLDYGKLAGETIYRDAEVELYRGEDVLEASPHPAIQTDALDEDDVIVRVPIITARIGADRLLGDEIVIWLRRDGMRFKIYRLLEDFQLQ
ncbi:MAG: hypothetical protein IT372_25155 [Polyangiaceae bacterium]|nr:hypothetical protein [Polyangiaceae bacterium]